LWKRLTPSKPGPNINSSVSNVSILEIDAPRSGTFILGDHASNVTSQQHVIFSSYNSP
jgi:hypothetical protein